MKLYSNILKENHLRNILPVEGVEIDYVKAAIAYGSDEETLVKNCLKNKLRLDIWMRYDHTVPVSSKLLRTLLRNTSNNIFCNLVPDVLHSKIIWWKGYGVYIGSANLTEKAWNRNIEFGVFIPEIELESNDNLEEIEYFFEELENCDAAFSLTDEIVNEQENIEKLLTNKRSILDNEAFKLRSKGVWGGLVRIDNRKNTIDMKKEKFVKEWTAGINILRELAAMAPEFRPIWLHENVPSAWQADQFLHAFYNNEVVNGASHPFEEYHKNNKSNPASAAERALVWWSKLPAPPSNEDINCHERAPVIRKFLSKEHISSITKDEFAEVCLANHSTVDHVRRMSLEMLGIYDSQNVIVSDRVKAFANWLWKKRNKNNEDVKTLLTYVFDGGPVEELPHRIFDATNNKDYKFQHFGLNQIAELAGWARPEIYPPRNGRTSKALRALGYSVKVY